MDGFSINCYSVKMYLLSASTGSSTSITNFITRVLIKTCISQALLLIDLPTGVLLTTQLSQQELAYHCDPSDSRYPLDKNFSKAPDQKGDLVYAHRPQIIWDSGTHSIINIAYCEGRSGATTALYKFLEDNLYKIIDPAAIKEIYADSEYTGEKQLVYLHIRSESQVTMCLQQKPDVSVALTASGAR